MLADWEWPEDVPGFLDQLACGLEQELRRADHGVSVATRVVLRQARTHIVDSSETSFLLGGRYAARQALARAFGPAWQGE